LRGISFREADPGMIGPQILSNCQQSCGCTGGIWKREPGCTHNADEIEVAFFFPVRQACKRNRKQENEGNEKDAVEGTTTALAAPSHCTLLLQFRLEQFARESRTSARGGGGTW
jgi:hypothetical protein